MPESNASALTSPKTVRPVSLTRAKGDTQSPSRRFLRQLFRRRTAVIGLAIIVAQTLALTFGPALSPYDPIEPSFSTRFEPPSVAHPMGTDEVGRDVLTRVLYGGRVSVAAGVFSVLLGLLVAVPMGVASGYYRGMVDEAIMRIVDIMLAFPGILLAIVIVAILGPSVVNVVFAVAVFAIPTFARVARGSTMVIREQAYVEAARSIGARSGRIILNHVLPNIAAPITVLISLGIGTAILSATGLSFIGLGASPPLPEWGLMLSSGRDYLRSEWWLATFPGLAILITVLGVNLLGDGLHDALDPRSNKR